MRKMAPWIVMSLVVAGFAAWYLYQRPAPDAHPSVRTLPEVREAPSQPRAEFPVVVDTPADVAPPEPLPPLAQSDEAVAQALAEFIGAERLGSVIILEQIINRVVATVDSLDSRQVAPLVWPVRPAEGEFQVQGEASLEIHPDNSTRYEPYVGLVAATDVNRAAAFYRRHYPLFQEAYEQLGYEDRYFNDRLVSVIDHLLDTPGTPDDLELVESESVYLFADQRMEDLSAGQKMLLRVGKDQRSELEQKLRSLRALLAGAASR